MAKKRGGHGGGHGWFVTFADLMALLMSFFVMLVAFSTQDQAKLQVVAGSMRDAFGVQDKVRYSGVLEVMGLPTRPKLKSVANIDPKDASPTPAPDEKGMNRTYGARMTEDRKFALASASLRQALQSMPEIAEVSKHVMLEETRQGLNIEITDQDGRSMFADGSKEPYERTRLLIQRIAPALKAMPFRISIAGHTATSSIPPRPGYGRLVHCQALAPSHAAFAPLRASSSRAMTAGREGTAMHRRQDRRSLSKRQRIAWFKYYCNDMPWLAPRSSSLTFGCCRSSQKT